MYKIKEILGSLNAKQIEKVKDYQFKQFFKLIVKYHLYVN